MTEESLNLDRFVLLADNDPAALKQIIDLYLSTTATQLEELSQAVKSNSLSSIERIAHSMIGASQMVGMVSWVPALRLLENHKVKSSGSAHDLLGQVISEFQRIREFLSAPLPDSL